MRFSRPEPAPGEVARARLAALVAEVTGRPDAAANDPDKRAGAASRPTRPGPSAPVPEAPRPGPAARAWAFGRAHLAVVGVVGLIALIGTVWGLTQARTTPVVSAVPTPVPAVVTPTPTPTPTPLRVHVLGAVARPGVVAVPDGSRVEDAVAAAGGMTAEARPGELNLAAPVGDGEQVVIGTRAKPGGEVRPPTGAGQTGGGGPAGAGGTGGSAASGGGLVDLNKASAEQLQSLPGVGPVTAQAILAWRTEHQRFSRVEELQEVDGIGPKTFAKLAPKVKV